MASTDQIEFIHQIHLVRVEEQTSVIEFTQKVYSTFNNTNNFIIPILIYLNNQTWGPVKTNTWMSGIYILYNTRVIVEYTILGTLLLFGYSNHVSKIYKNIIRAGVEEDFSDVTIGDWYEYDGQKIV